MQIENLMFDLHFSQKETKGASLGSLDLKKDEQGLLLDEERLPQRVRIKKSRSSL
jgi:hypothetical protein